jgi:hypothetical protein
VISAAALLGLSEEPGTLADGEPLAAHIVRDLAYAAGSTWRRLVTDPVTGEAIELISTSYAPPPRLREAVHVRDGTCRAPGSTHPAERCDLDHDLPWDQGGATSAANLSAKSRRPHGHKTRGQWTTTQSPDGTIVWTTGTGRQYTTYPYQYDPTAPGRPTSSRDSRGSTSPRPEPDAPGADDDHHGDDHGYPPYGSSLVGDGELGRGGESYPLKGHPLVGDGELGRGGESYPLKGHPLVGDGELGRGDETCLEDGGIPIDYRPPIDYRARGVTPATRPARRPPEESSRPVDG